MRGNIKSKGKNSTLKPSIYQITSTQPFLILCKRTCKRVVLIKIFSSKNLGHL